MSDNKLTNHEASEYVRCNQTIKNTKGSFIACGKALETIRDKKLFRHKYKNFIEYCEVEWGWGKSHAYRLIEASNYVTQVPQDQQKSVPHGGKSVPQTERETRGKLDESKRKSEPKPPDIIELDKTGYPIPELAMEYWNRAPEIQEKLTAISKLRAWAKELQDTRDPMFAEVNMNGIYCDLGNAYRNLKQALPYTVCPVCQGQAPKSCVMCTGRGVISQFAYETAIPEETKNIRSKVAKG